MTRTNIENYLDAVIVKQETGIDCAIPQYGKPTDPAGNALGKRTLKKIKDAGQDVVQQMGAAGIVSYSKDGNGNCEFVNIFEKIRQAFGFQLS